MKELEWKGVDVTHLGGMMHDKSKVGKKTRQLCEYMQVPLHLCPK